MPPKKQSRLQEAHLKHRPKLPSVLPQYIARKTKGQIHREHQREAHNKRYNKLERQQQDQIRQSNFRQFKRYQKQQLQDAELEAQFPDLQDEDIFTDPNELHHLPESQINELNRRRQDVLNKYSSADGSEAWNRLNKRNRENVLDRLDQAKRIQFMVETGIPLSPERPTDENQLGLEIFQRREHERSKQESPQAILSQLRTQAIQNKELERLKKMENYYAALNDPSNVPQIQAEIARQKQQKFIQYHEKKEKARIEQDRFMQRFRQKQELRKSLIEGTYNDEQINKLIEEDEEMLSRYKDGNDDHNNDINTNLPTTIKDDVKYPNLSSLKRSIEKQEPLTPHDIRNVFTRVRTQIDQEPPSLATSHRDREQRLTKIRKQIGLLPLRQRAQKELQDEAYTRLSNSIHEQKRKLAEQFDKANIEDMNLPRKSDGSEDLAPFEDHDDSPNLFGITKPRQLGIRPRKKQMYAPIIITPPTGFKYKDPLLPHDHNESDNDIHTNELSVLQKHLGLTKASRPDNWVLRKARKMRPKRQQIYNHLRSKLRKKLPSELVAHPVTGEMVPRNSLSYIHRVKSDVLAEFKQKHEHLDSLSEEERAEYIRASIGSARDIPRQSRHELRTRQFFGDPVIDTTQDENLQRYEHMIFNTHSEALTLTAQDKILSTHVRERKDPSDFRVERLRPDLALPAPHFNKHIDPITKRRGIHLLHRGHEVFVPKLMKPLGSEIKLSDGMVLKINADIFTNEFDPELDATRNNFSMRAHERPKHENQGGYLLDSDGNDISKNKIDPDSIDNLTRFHNTYGEIPTNYVNKVYHDVLGNTLLQQSRQFMQDVHSIHYQRPFDSLIAKFAPKPKNDNSINNDNENDTNNNNNNNEVDLSSLEPIFDPITGQLKYHHTYDDPNFRTIKPPPQYPNHFKLPNRFIQAKNKLVDSVVQTLRFAQSDPDLYDYRSDPQREQLQSNINNIINSNFKNNPDIDKISSKFFQPTKAPEHLIRSAYEADKQFNAPLAPNVKISKSFSEFLPTLLKEKYSQHDFYSNNIRQIRSESIQRDFNRLKSTTLLVQKALQPITNNVEKIYHKSSNLLNNLISPYLKNRVEMPTHSLATQTAKNSTQIPPSLQSHLSTSTNSTQKFINPNLYPTSYEFQLLKNLENETRELSQQQQPSQSQLTPFDSTRVANITNRLNNISTPQIRHKLSQIQSLKSQTESLPLQDHFRSYIISNSSPQLSIALRKTSVLLNPATFTAPSIQESKISNTSTTNNNNSSTSSPTSYVDRITSLLNPTPSQISLPQIPSSSDDAYRFIQSVQNKHQQQIPRSSLPTPLATTQQIAFQRPTSSIDNFFSTRNQIEDAHSNTRTKRG